MVTVCDSRQDTFPACADKKKEGKWKPKPGDNVAEDKATAPRADAEKQKNFFAREQVIAALCLYEPFSDEAADAASPAHEKILMH